MSDIVKKLWAKFYAWALPTALTLGVYYLLVHPRTTFDHGWFGPVSDGQFGGIAIAVVATISISLNAFSTALYRVLEGYLLWPKWLQKWGEDRQLRRKNKLQRAAEAKENIGWRRGLALEKLALYPKDDKQIAPTRFGNAFRAFETYGKTRYNLDSQSLWYELCAVCPKYLQAELDEVRSGVDFFVALIYLNGVLSMATFGVLLVEGFKPQTMVVCAAAFAMSIFCHWLAVRATRDWSYAVQALVNIGRVKLADSMGLQLPANLEEERKMWGLVTRYGFFCDPAEGKALDQFRKPLPTPASTSTTVEPGRSAPVSNSTNKAEAGKDDDDEDPEG